MNMLCSGTIQDCSQRSKSRQCAIPSAFNATAG
jgi:hypothetical protein